MDGKVKIEDFQLKKSKLKDGIVEVTYSVNVKSSGDVRHPKIDDKIKDPHPDLIKSINAFKETLLKIWNYDDNGDQVEISGLSVKHTDDNTGIVITGKNETETGTVAMNSPLIWLENGEMGFEKKLKFFTDNHEKEIYLALYEGKTSQKKIEFPEDK